MNFNDDEAVEEVVCLWNLDGDDADHIRRLQALRESGLVNMATELRYGLREVFPEHAEQTYDWAVNKYPEYYFGGDWVDVDPSNLE
jgi:hypothetical protein